MCLELLFVVLDEIVLFFEFAFDDPGLDFEDDGDDFEDHLHFEGVGRLFVLHLVEGFDDFVGLGGVVAPGGVETEALEVVFDDADEEFGLDFQGEVLEYFVFVPFEAAQRHLDALVVDFEEYLALFLPQPCVDSGGLVAQFPVHSADVLVESPLAQRDLIVNTGELSHLVDKVDQRQGESNDPFIQSFKQSSDFDIGDIDEIDTVGFYFTVFIDLVPNEIFHS